jgi:hypothetical protein
MMDDYHERMCECGTTVCIGLYKGESLKSREKKPNYSYYYSLDCVPAKRLNQKKDYC